MVLAKATIPIPSDITDSSLTQTRTLDKKTIKKKQQLFSVMTYVLDINWIHGW